MNRNDLLLEVSPLTAKILRKALPIQRGFEKMTIKLEQVIEAIEMSDDSFTSFWDTKTGETVAYSE